ncbi:MAG: hypothetical protein H6666_02400 [Ardenticatenaceae bacterium]|nr:hypothetical protein [Anaerolineales bacterium]MCB8916751.1 hypothetical protein [Ardenticatenaceae bacterium]
MLRNLSFGVWVIIFVAAVLAIGLVGTLPFAPITVRWLLIIAVIVAFMALLGKRIHNRYDGILVDTRFKIGLSRVQLVLWTVLAFSAFLAIGLERNRMLLAGVVTDAGFNPLDITFPPELLVALGISTASLAGAGLITNAKKETVSSRKIELLTDERTRYADEQQAAQVELSGALAAVKSLAAEENQLRGSLADRDATLAQLTTDLAAQQTAVQQAQQTAQANPSDVGAQTALAQSKADLAALQGKLASTKADITRLDAAIQATRDKQREATAKSEQAKVAFERATQELDRIDEATRNRAGVVYKKESPDQASWLDIFRGDDISNYQIIDVAKIQMFFFTIAIVFTYGVLIWALMSSQETMQMNQISFPPFSDTLNALLGLSHAGYLVVKSVG